MKSLLQLSLLSFLVVFILTCKRDIKNSHERILGTWYHVLTPDEPPPPEKDTIMYTFMKDSAIYYPGIYEAIDTMDCEIQRMKYMNNIIKYTITEDSLTLFFPYINNNQKIIPVKYKIFKLDNDSLIIINNIGEFKGYRKYPKTNKNQFR